MGYGTWIDLPIVCNCVEDKAGSPGEGSFLYWLLLINPRVLLLTRLTLPLAIHSQQLLAMGFLYRRHLWKCDPAACVSSLGGNARSSRTKVFQLELCLQVFITIWYECPSMAKTFWSIPRLTCFLFGKHCLTSLLLLSQCCPWFDTLIVFKCTVGSHMAVRLFGVVSVLAFWYSLLL